MPGTPAPFSVIVPVHNEASRLGETALALMDGLPEDWELIFVCNGCTDGSETILERIAGRRAIILTAPRGKAVAIREGEARARFASRFYVDSDVLIHGADLARLATCLTAPVELVSPRMVFDLAGVGPQMRRVLMVWLSLPHAQGAAYHHVLGVSAAGRARWGEFPDLLADDAFIESRIPDGRKRVVPDVVVTVRPPRSMTAWLGVRARWHDGHGQMRAMGYAPPHAPGQYRAIAQTLHTPSQWVNVLLYVGSVLAARLLSALPRRGWYRDETSR
ncbi:glycosyltransferase family 2 protein [Qipengyuania sp.]|uniref:glycosyltransferase family 2 protein n=1 Tax=Qipengyuania sp. TaxID=2004515 RepID=UPI0035C85E6A